MQVDAPSGTVEAVKRVRVECEGPTVTLCHVFQGSLARVLARRSSSYEVRLRPGRQAGEVLAVINATGRPLPLSLFFPEAASLSAEDVERIVQSVLEGMGPTFP